ncbi:2-hydroxymuconate-semialdehyde hydrolase [Nocardiopsis aegyptia]|uniref:2-hydroxymuconate-semialdehyde hydrolase n=1 Tax=Nocardiopsis aegyptia TaxID=220378 RepID=A0A7Z0JAE2_9ACTN|nr:2-hydroxymuconate-semialdehyde hydrolase [Nocardiopsis aegyptia]
MWEPLSDRFTCIAPDLLGFGTRIPRAHLPRGPRAWSRARAHQLLELLDQLDLDRVHLVGNSAAGGAAGLALMAMAPGRVSRAVLMGGAGTGPQPVDIPFYGDPTRASMRKTLARLVADQRDHLRLIEELTDLRWRQALAPGAEQAFRAMFDSDEGVERSPDFAGITTPVLALHGELDRVSPIEVSERLVRRLPNARLMVVAAAGHWVHVDRPHEFCTEVEEFLST